MFTRLRQIAEIWTGRHRPGWRILMYHRITDVKLDPWSIGVTPDHFAEHLEVLQKRACVLTLATLVDQIRNSSVKDNAFVITFDDGYADNLKSARPLLERYTMNATVFVTTAGFAKQREFWWDELERIFLQPGSLPPLLQCNVNGTLMDFNLEDVVDYSDEQYRTHQKWRTWDEPPTARQRIYRTLWKMLQPLEYDRVQSVLKDLREWAGINEMPRDTHRPLSADEIVLLNEDGLVEIGAHSVTHPVLPSLLEDAQLKEIQKSKLDLQEILGRPVLSFAYPFGHFDKVTISATRHAGFSCACTAAGFDGRRLDLFQLPRVPVLDCDGDEFARRLSLNP